MPPRFRPRATWLGSLTALNAIDQFETTNGAKKFADLGGGTLLRKPVLEYSALEDDLATVGGHILVVGDFFHYVIVDRVGATLELVNHLFSPTNLRPTGQRGLFYWWRVGGDVVVDNAFRRLTVSA